VQIRAKKIVSSVKLLPYKDRLKRLKLTMLKFRRIRGDMIEVYKVNNQNYEKNTTITFDFVGNSEMRAIVNMISGGTFLQIELYLHGIVDQIMWLMNIVLIYLRTV